ncbi:MAG TPA: hypothetical protein VM120_20965 [Bryobacteraceae bacterium]|nr:hypothetical protein [Bryobacteraceae bacterium]
MSASNSDEWPSGLYRLIIKSPIVTTAGFVVLSQGEILGGDGTFFFKGLYYVEGDRVQLALSMEHPSVDGTGKFLGIDFIALEGNTIDLKFRGTNRAGFWIIEAELVHVTGASIHEFNRRQAEAKALMTETLDAFRASLEMHYLARAGETKTLRLTPAKTVSQKRRKT